MVERTIRLGTRGSRLARRQAESVRAALEAHRYDVSLVEISTAGDRLDDELVHRLGRTGAFVRDIDERVLDDELDGAIHSLKDMPTEMPPELIVAAIPERARPHDVLVSPEGDSLAELPEGATIGTGSLRRCAQTSRQRPDVVVEPIRGNVDTRVEKLLAGHLQETATEFDDEEERAEWENTLDDLERAALNRNVDTTYDALVLAAAGLDRAELSGEVPTVELPLEQFVPAPGQGALAITMCDTDEASAIHQQIDHPPSRVAATVERTVLARLGGGCIAPIGVHAVLQGAVVRTRAQILSRDGQEVIDVTRELPVEEHVDAAIDLAGDLANSGATELIAAATRNAGNGPDPP